MFLKYSVGKELGSVHCYRWRLKERNTATHFTGNNPYVTGDKIKLTCAEFYCCKFPFDLEFADTHYQNYEK